MREVGLVVKLILINFILENKLIIFGFCGLRGKGFLFKHFDRVVFIILEV